MRITTLHLPDELVARIAAAARLNGTSPHAFILAAINEKLERDERSADFDSVAEQRYARIVASGMTISWGDMRAHLEARMVDEPA